MTRTRTDAPGRSYRHGWDRAVRLVREFLLRPDDKRGCPRSRRVPVLVFTGPRGSGKSALLTEIARQADQNLPCAWVNCEANAEKSVRELLTELAFELNQRCGDYGTVAFPRFVIGRLVLLLDLDLTQAARARDQVEQALERHRKVDKLRDFLGDAVPDLLSSIPTVNHVPGVNTMGRFLPDLALNAVVKGQRGRRVVLGRAQDWYGHQDSGLTRNPLDVLVNLNRSARGETMRHDGHVDELLWAAFLADLREGFRGKHAERRTFNCAVLLDNVDARLGRDFLDGLVQARRLHDVYDPNDPDPLTVIGTARGEFAERRVGAAVPLSRASFADFQSRVDDEAEGGWYRVSVEDLSQEQVTAMVAGLDAHVVHSRAVSRAIHRFTGGHRGSTRLLLDAVVETGGEVSELTSLLEAQPEHLDGRTVQDRVLDELLADVPSQAHADLTTSAAARDLDQALQMAARSPFFEEKNTENSGVFESWLWREDRTMRPVLRRLLLRRLAARDDEDPASWYYVNSWLRHRYQESKDEGGELYHALALGEIEQVAQRMSELLVTRDTRDWLALVWSITEAPNRLAHDRPPIEEFAALNRSADPREREVATTGRLISALWIMADPLSAPNALDQQVRTALNELAPHAGDGMAVLFDEAKKWDWAAR